MKYMGRSEKVSFPDLGIEAKEAKIDTGAYGNVLHVDDIFIKEDKLFFSIEEKEYIYEKYKTIVVKNSFGKKQKRFSIMTRILLGEKTYKVDISLTNRKKMKYPMLIGRRFLNKFRYIVNVRKKNINDRAKAL